jgi:hypothetical protein
MTRPMLILTCCYALSIGLLSCNKQTTEDIAVDFGYQYFPLELGQTRTYQVDSILFDPDISGTAIDSSTSFAREVIIDTIRSINGAVQYIIERSIRSDAGAPWQTTDIWTATRTEQQAFRTEENLRFLKLTFPIDDQNRWDPTLFFDNTLEITVAGETLEAFRNWEGRMQETGAMVEILGQTYTDVIKTTLADDTNLIERRYVSEWYAPELGLIFSEKQILDTQCQVCCSLDFELCDALPWRQKAEKGLIVRQQLLPN